jgi:hypothetical protein
LARWDSNEWNPETFMRALRWTAALWPGLLQAWVLGCWRSLALATAFAAALNLALVATLIWPRWPTGAPAGLVGSVDWVFVVGLWVWGAFRLRRDWARLVPPRQSHPQIDDWFRQAQHAYLQGHWLEAERLVKEILRRRPADVETRLLRASVERRTKQFDTARNTLEELLNDAAAARWRLEIAAELKQIAEAEAEGAEKDPIARAA